MLLLLVAAGSVALLLAERGIRGLPPGLPHLGPFQDEPTIRVLLTDLDPDHVVEIGGRPLLVAPDARVRAPGDTVRIGASAAGLVADGHALPATFRIRPGGDAPLTIDGQPHPGTLEVLREGERWILVEHVPLETYVTGVVLAELGPTFPDAALAAQAVVSRSYALERMARRASAAWDLRADQRAQVYRGVPVAADQVRRQVAATAGIILAWDGRILPGLFSSTCGGTTRPAGEAFGGPTLPPLSGVRCGWCDGAPLARWTARRRLAPVTRSLGLVGPPTAVAITSRTASDRLAEATFTVAGRAVPVGVTALKRALGPSARSTWITDLTLEGGRLVAQGRGFGHGVGLCQHGARAQALAGRSWLAILEHAFPGAGLARAWVHAP